MTSDWPSHDRDFLQDFCNVPLQASVCSNLSHPRISFLCRIDISVVWGLVISCICLPYQAWCCNMKGALPGTCLGGLEHSNQTRDGR